MKIDGFPRINRIMVLSTDHISNHTASLIDDETLEYSFSARSGSFFGRADGWIFFVGDKPTDGPDDLERVLAYARKHGCQWLMLDTDGPIVRDLPLGDVE